MTNKEQAETYAFLLKQGAVDYDTAVEKIKPYIDEYNKKAKELAKKYNRKPKLISFKAYIRWI